MQNKKDFISKLIIEFPEMIDVLQKSNKYWFPDSPPLTILLSDLARSMAEIILTRKRRKNLFELLETNLKNGEENLSQAIATGFIETYYYTLRDKNCIDNDFFSDLGEQSNIHLQGVINFFG